MIDPNLMIAIDNECHLIAASRVAPPMVCVSISDCNHDRVIHRRDPECRRQIVRIIDACLSTHYLVGQNVAFDLAVWANEWPELLPLIFHLYDTDRVLDTMDRQKLIDIAHGEYRGRQTATGWVEYRYNLEHLAKRHGYEIELDKDTWRLRYAELDHVPVADWPEEAVSYSRHDARSTRHVAVCQEREHSTVLEDQHRQARAAWALHLISAWGIRTDRVMVARHRANTEAKMKEYEALLVREGLAYQDKNGKWHKRQKLAQERAVAAWGGDVPRDYATPTGAPKLDEDSTKALKDPVLIAFQQFGSASTVMSRVEELEQGIDLPLHTRFDTIMDTGRTSSSKPNIQNRQVEPGDRECFVARKGNTLLDADVDGLELRCIAQSLRYAGFHSMLGEMLNTGIDPHAVIAARTLGVTYEEVIRRKADPNDLDVYNARQTGKVANFGLNGGCGVNGLIFQARTKYGVILTVDSAKELIGAWHDSFPEFRPFFNWVRQLGGASGRAWIRHFVSNRQRGDLPFTVTCNTFSQGLGADATKHATWKLACAQYNDRNSILFGTRCVNYVHDQWITEVPDCDQLQEFADAKRVVLTDAVNEWLRDYPTIVKPIATRRWSKLAKKTVDAHGRLVPWEWKEAIAAGSPGYAT